MAQLEQEVIRLRQFTAELVDFVDNVPVGMHRVGADGIVLWVNQGELDALGLKQEEFVGHHIAEFHDDPLAVQDMLKRLGAGETLESYPARLRARDGSIRNVLIDANVLSESGRFMYTRCITRDVTDLERGEDHRQRAHESLRLLEEEARKREELFRAALQGSPVVVFHQNAELRYTWVYNPFLEHVGLSLLDKLDCDLFPPAEAEQLNQLKLGVLSSGNGTRQELALTTQGELRVMDLRIEPFRDSSGRLAGIVGTAVDITERKRSEERLRESRSELRNLAAHLQVLREHERELTSHEVDDLAQRLTALQLQLSVLEGHLGKGADPNSMAAHLRAVSGILGSTIERSAKISTELRPSLLDNAGLAATLDWYARTFASRTGIRVLFDALEDVVTAPEIGLAAFRIFQDALTNVERHSKAAEVHITLRGGGRLLLKVSDNGRGIPMEKVFDPQSFGLLAMRELALRYGGMTDVQGVSGEGTTLFLDIPLDDCSLHTLA